MKYILNRNILHLLAISITILCCAVIIAAQEPNKPTEKTDKNKEIEEKALLMLYSVIADAEKLKLPDNRAKVLITTSDILWKIDEVKARELMQESQNILLTILTPNETENNIDSEATNPWHIFELRRQIMQTIAKHDPDSALSFLTSSRAIIEKMPGYHKTNEQQLEATLLQYIPNSNPKRGLQLAKEHILSTNNITNIPGVIHSLHNKDREAASELIDITISQVKSNTQYKEHTLNALGNILHSAPPPDTHSTTTGDARYMTNRKQAKEISELIIKIMQTQLASIKSSTNANPSYATNTISHNLSYLSKQIEGYTPESKEALKKIKSDYDSIIGLINPSQKRWSDFNEAVKNHSTEKVLELAKTAPPDTQNSYYSHAINKMANEGNFEQARKVANENIKDVDQLSSSLRNIEYRQMEKQVNEKNFNDALSSIKNMNNSSQKLRAYIRVAQNARSTRDTAMAEAMLNEAYSLISGAPTTSLHFQNQLMIAKEFLPINVNQSFEIIDLAIEKLSEILDASVIVWEFERRGNVRKGELIGVNSRDSSYFPSLFEVLPSLYKSDPDRTEATVNKINRNDARIIIKLALLEHLFTGDNAINRATPGDRGKIEPLIKVNRRN